MGIYRLSDRIVNGSNDEARMTRLRSASAWQANQHELERAENHGLRG
jgi:hypothetical protein